MSENSEPVNHSSRETSKGLRTLGTITGLDLIVGELAPEQLARVWNKLLAAEGKEAGQSAAAKTRIAHSFRDFRRVFREAVRRNGGKNAALTETVSGEWGVGDISDELAALLEPAPEPEPEPAAIFARVGRPLTPLEQKMLVASAAKNGSVPVTKAASTDVFGPEVAAALARAADEAQAQNQLKSDYILWCCTRADEILRHFHELEGEDLWRTPILVESFPQHPAWKAVFVCSSTAPLIRDRAVASPTVKHDFRANEAPVTHSHPLAFKQADGMKVIRSKVIRKGAHEYYVKALEYSEGTFFKGYFVVDGVEDSNTIPPRYYKASEGRITRISEDDYKTLQNRLAAKRR